MSSQLPQRLAERAERWRTGELDAAAFAALYFFHWQIARHGEAFAARKRKTDVRPDATALWAALPTAGAEALRAQLLTFLGRYQFRGVTPAVPIALSEWLHGNWPLDLRADVPAPFEVLRAQARGTRPVTALTAYPRMLQPVLHKADAFAFFLHDLEHAYQFFHAPFLHAAQHAFFVRLEAAVDGGVFAAYLDDPLFVAKFHYLMSDMNTHPEHSRQYLRAILVEYYLRRAGRAPSAALAPGARRAIEAVVQRVAPTGRQTA